MISIIMIVYDVERYVEESIKSVIAQTCEDIELIIVADHGDDRSEEICRKYADIDPRIRLITGEARGIADARNRGLEAVRGDYIGFVDSDDYIEPDMFETMLGNLRQYDADIAICGRFYEYRNRTLKDEAQEPRVMSAEEALSVTLGHTGFFLHCWDKLFKAELFSGIDFRTDVTVEDRIVVDRLLSRADRIVYDPTPKYHFRERSGSNSKRSGMVRKNIQANILMEEFVTGTFPGLADKCAAFMLYEYITAIQNELVCDSPDGDDIREYADYVKRTAGSRNPLIGRGLRLKAFMAVYARPVLKVYTKRRQNKTAARLERFP